MLVSDLKHMLQFTEGSLPLRGPGLGVMSLLLSSSLMEMSK